MREGKISKSTQRKWDSRNIWKIRNVFLFFKGFELGFCAFTRLARSGFFFPPLFSTASSWKWRWSQWARRWRFRTSTPMKTAIEACRRPYPGNPSLPPCRSPPQMIRSLCRVITLTSSSSFYRLLVFPSLIRFFWYAVEVCLKPSSTAQPDDIRTAVERSSFTLFCIKSAFPKE